MPGSILCAVRGGGVAFVRLHWSGRPWGGSQRRTRGRGGSLITWGGGRHGSRAGGWRGIGEEAEKCFALSPEDEEAAVVHRRKSQTAHLVYGPPGRSIDFTECTQGTAVHRLCLRTTRITSEVSAGVGPEEIQRVAPTSCFVPGTRARRRVAEDGLCGPAQRDSPSAPCLWQFLTTNPQPTARPGWPLCLAVSFASTVYHNFMF
jgi:hypothetical protein